MRGESERGRARASDLPQRSGITAEVMGLLPEGLRRRAPAMCCFAGESPLCLPHHIARARSDSDAAAAVLLFVRLNYPELVAGKDAPLVRAFLEGLSIGHPGFLLRSSDCTNSCPVGLSIDPELLREEPWLAVARPLGAAPGPPLRAPIGRIMSSVLAGEPLAGFPDGLAILPEEIPAPERAEHHGMPPVAAAAYRGHRVRLGSWLSGPGDPGTPITGAVCGHGLGHDALCWTEVETDGRSRTVYRFPAAAGPHSFIGKDREGFGASLVMLLIKWAERMRQNFPAVAPCLQAYERVAGAKRKRPAQGARKTGPPADPEVVVVPAPSARAVDPFVRALYGMALSLAAAPARPTPAGKPGDAAPARPAGAVAWPGLADRGRGR